jgi:hypothetical protein
MHKHIGWFAGRLLFPHESQLGMLFETKNSCGGLTGSFCEQISVFEYFFLSLEGGFCELMRFEYLFKCEVNGPRK